MQLKMEPSWNSPILEGAYTICGWLAFFFWSSCFYPQVILNFRRKSVVGLNFNYALLSNTKNTLYFIYNACFYFSASVQLEYHKRFGFQELIPVAVNDVALSSHSVVLTAFILFQIAIYDRGNQTFSKFAVAIVSAMWLARYKYVSHASNISRRETLQSTYVVIMASHQEPSFKTQEQAFLEAASTPAPIIREGVQYAPDPLMEKSEL